MSDQNENPTGTNDSSVEPAAKPVSVETAAKPVFAKPRTERETVYRVLAPWLIRRLRSRRVTATGQELQRLGYRVALLLHKGVIVPVEAETVEEPPLTPEDLDLMQETDINILDAVDDESDTPAESDGDAKVMDETKRKAVVDAAMAEAQAQGRDPLDIYYDAQMGITDTPVEDLPLAPDGEAPEAKIPTVTGSAPEIEAAPAIGAPASESNPTNSPASAPSRRRRS